jgi:hypothetical protein
MLSHSAPIYNNSRLGMLRTTYPLFSRQAANYAWSEAGNQVRVPTGARSSWLVKASMTVSPSPRCGCGVVLSRTRYPHRKVRSHRFRAHRKVPRMAALTLSGFCGTLYPAARLTRARRIKHPNNRAPSSSRAVRAHGRGRSSRSRDPDRRSEHREAALP